jgi:CRISPR-associated endoribonuclease Cas6
MTALKELGRLLQGIPILPRQMLLETPGVQATVPLLRGVWGAALRELDDAVFRTVFDPQTGSGREASPAYLLRPAPPDPAFAPAVDWISFEAALPHDALLLRAWEIASAMGLGPLRQPFFIRETRLLQADGTATASGDPWTLDRVSWPLADPTAPCRLVFPAPLRLMFRGRLVKQPTLPDLVVAACRRFRAVSPPTQRDGWEELGWQALALARETATGPWQGERLDLHRYSARQQVDLELRGVSGSLELTHGPGDLWPLLAAAQWLHLGKGTVMGLGQLIVEEQDDGRA